MGGEGVSEVGGGLPMKVPLPLEGLTKDGPLRDAMLGYFPIQAPEVVSGRETVECCLQTEASVVVIIIITVIIVCFVEDPSIHWRLLADEKR